MKYLKTKAQQGQWWRDVWWEDGTVERLPCIHKPLIDFSNLTYHDPLDGLSMQDPQVQRHLDHLGASKHVVVLDSVERPNWIAGGGRFEPGAKVFDIFAFEDLKIEDHGFRLRLTERHKRLR